MQISFRPHLLLIRRTGLGKKCILVGKKLNSLGKKKYMINPSRYAGPDGQDTLAVPSQAPTMRQPAQEPSRLRRSRGGGDAREEP